MQLMGFQGVRVRASYCKLASAAMIVPWVWHDSFGCAVIYDTGSVAVPKTLELRRIAGRSVCCISYTVEQCLYSMRCRQVDQKR